VIDALKEEFIVNKVGGRFKLSTLIQKRLVALNSGARPLVHAPANKERLEVVIQEIIQDKIYLDTENNVRTNAPSDGSGGPPELDLSEL
jgi:DNA-directed RNA polymerase subunit omega